LAGFASDPGVVALADAVVTGAVVLAVVLAAGAALAAGAVVLAAALAKEVLGLTAACERALELDAGLAGTATTTGALLTLFSSSSWAFAGEACSPAATPIAHRPSVTEKRRLVFALFRTVVLSVYSLVPAITQRTVALEGTQKHPPIMPCPEGALRFNRSRRARGPPLMILQP
jgi:hypothetical protein